MISVPSETIRATRILLDRHPNEGGLSFPMRRITVACFAVLLPTAAIGGCNRDGVSVPPLVEQAEPRIPGKFVWHNLVTPDAARARMFYGELFGWTFDVQDGGKYSTVYYEGRNLGGILQASGDGAPKSGVWLSAVSTADIDRALERAELGGAKQLDAVTELPNVGRLAVITDPEGAVIQLLESSNGDPPDTEPRVHTWLWRELISNDPPRAAMFYAGVFGYALERVADSGTGLESYFVLGTADAPRAGIFENPFEQTRPTWIPYVRVDDPGAIVERVTELGGSVVVAPRPELRNGTLALILDPTGAPIALQQWSPKEGT